MNETLKNPENIRDISLKELELEDLKIVWQSLFSFELDEDEFIEIAYDKKDKHFGNAIHIQTFEELVGFLKEKNGKCNIAICPSIRLIEDSQKDKRTKGDYITKQEAIILDIDHPINHFLLREEDTRKWYASWEQVWRWKKPKNENTP